MNQPPSLHHIIPITLHRGPMCSPQIARAAGASPLSMGKALARLVGERHLKFCGFAVDAQVEGEFPSQIMWGLRSHKPFPALSVAGTRIACPSCGSHQVYRLRSFDQIECHACNTRFIEGEERPDVIPKARQDSSSGQPAGRITIGRGTRWSWVG